LFAEFLRLLRGNYFVFGIQPRTQIYQFASLAAKGKEFGFFGLFVMW